MECLDFEFHKTPFQLIQCPSCGAVLVHPLPKTSELVQYYGSQYHQKPSLFFSFIQKNRQGRFSGLKPGKLLDVGCGSGTFLEAMHQKGWLCNGTEFSDSAKRFLNPLQKKGIDIQYGQLLDLHFSQAPFDLITFWHVLEHLAEPQREIAFACKLLKKGGILFMAVPNIDSISFSIWKCNWFHLDLPRHLTHFSPKNLSRILDQNGFEVIRISHFALEYNPYGILQSIYNSLGFEFNLLTNKIKAQKSSQTAGKSIQLVLIALLLPFLLPLSFFLAYLFSWAKRGDTISVWARKR
ncbi:class I SAM-dependent methyltransferase [Candidatus Micrarchaeota archaeon]|nr:class I SAM-dependent methyltransferase [Candidatus Micrarchaeota archaeon]